MPKQTFAIGDSVVVTGVVDPAKPGGELLGKHLKIARIAGTVTTDDGSEWHTWENGGYNWELPRDLWAPGVGSAYQAYLKIEHVMV